MAGGVARDGWWMLGTGRERLLRRGVPGTGVVKKFRFTTEAADITLEVRVEGREPYDVQGLFTVEGRPEVAPGDVVPVRVHPKKPKRVAIDWNAVDDSSGDGGVSFRG